VLSQTETKKNQAAANQPEAREIIAAVRLNPKNNLPSEITAGKPGGLTLGREWLQ
jgi:hypothetical protein